MSYLGGCQMKSSKTIIIFAVIPALLFISRIASADTFAFQDTRLYWPGYTSNAGDSMDNIGEPQITDGTVTISNGYITKVVFNYLADPGWLYDIMKPGDLFIDLNPSDQWNDPSYKADSNWDYVVSSYNGRSNDDETNKYIPTGSVGLYNTSGGGLLITNASDGQGYWAGYGIRNGHPYAYTDLNSFISGAIITGGFHSTSVIFDLTNGGLASGLQLTGDSLLIGFAENCANDVVYERIEVPGGGFVPAPEPSTLCLMGLGLVCGFFTLKRRA
jgi:hypothetical protein